MTSSWLNCPARKQRRPAEGDIATNFESQSYDGDRGDSINEISQGIAPLSVLAHPNGSEHVSQSLLNERWKFQWQMFQLNAPRLARQPLPTPQLLALAPSDSLHSFSAPPTLVSSSPKRGQM